MLFKLDDSVKVKEGIMCPDDDSLCIGGWQGRIFEIDKEEDLVGICWDSITLKQLPYDYIKTSEKEGLDCSQIYLSASEVDLVSPRDSKEQARNATEKLENKFQWITEDQEDKRIFNIIADADDEMDAWNQYLSKVLAFPFEAKVSEHQDHGPLKIDDNIQVCDIIEADEHYGILVGVSRQRERFTFPLCDLTVGNKKSPNYIPVNDYCVWFANR